MFYLYSKTKNKNDSSYKFRKQCWLFGCNKGYIPRLLEKQTPAGQGEPYKWHIPIQKALDATEDRGSTLIIDLKPKQQKTNLSLYEVLDVWGYSDHGWTPILLHLRGLFIDEKPKPDDRKVFSIEDSKNPEPIYEFLHLSGTVRNGKLVGPWILPRASSPNAALLWPETLRYFIECIQARTPSVLG